MHKKLLYPIAVAVTALSIASVLILTAKPIEASSEARHALAVMAITAKSSQIEFQVNSQGSIEPRVQSQLTPEVSGVIGWVSPALVAGGVMSKGQALLKVEPEDYENHVTSTTSALTRAQSTLKRAKQEHRRIVKLHAKKLASRSLLENTENELNIAQANVDDAKANNAKARRDLKRTVLTAPYDGLVRTESVDVGQFISRGNPIATIYATDYVEVRLPIADSQLAFLDLKQINNGSAKPKVRLSGTFAGQKRTWQAHIERMEAQIDAKSRMLNAVAQFKPQPDESAPVGLFVKASIQGSKTSGLFAVPRSAMRGSNRVLLIKEGRLVDQTVTVLRLENQRAIISSGLKDGDIVCTSRNQALAQGTEVQAEFQQ